jgi:hypothetical protein
MPVDHLIPILQVSIGPVILISGIGLLILSMTNRFSRIIERSRQLTRELRLPGAHANRSVIEGQLVVLLRQARMVRSAIFLAGISVLLASILIMLLFLTALLGFNSAILIISLFFMCMASLVLSLILYLKDINASLTAVKLEVGEKHWEEP